MIIIHNDERIRAIVKNLDEIEAEIDKLIFVDDDLDAAVEWMDSRTYQSEELHREIKLALESQE